LNAQPETVSPAIERFGGKPLLSAHYLAEEVPEATLAELQAFFEG